MSGGGDAEREATMHIQLVRYRAGISDKEVQEQFEARSGRYRQVPGLLQKYYVRYRETGEFGGIYVWESEESLNAREKLSSRRRCALPPEGRLGFQNYDGDFSVGSSLILGITVIGLHSPPPPEFSFGCHSGPSDNGDPRTGKLHRTGRVGKQVQVPVGVKITPTPRSEDNEARTVTEIQERNRVLATGVPSPGIEKQHVVVHQPFTSGPPGSPEDRRVKA